MGRRGVISSFNDFYLSSLHVDEAGEGVGALWHLTVRYILDEWLLQVQAAGSAAKAMGANVKLAEAMGSTAQTMGQMNRMMNPAQV